MNDELVDKIARAVLYEGYILYPYRPCVKSQQRWTFGGLYPQSWTDAQRGGDPSFMQTECLINGDPAATVRVSVRFLHLINRTVGELPQPIKEWSADHESALKEVASLSIGETKYYPWQEATEREVDAGDFHLSDLLDRPRQIPFSFPADRSVEPLRSNDRMIVGALVREQQAIAGRVEVSAKSRDGLTKITAIICNLTPMDLAITRQRDDALMRTLISTHAILSVSGGEFVSLTDPPAAWKEQAASCHNIGNWPVLVGIEPDRSRLLASPIILYDYPQIAPESPGDLFDATEIDEILSLRILTLTDEEKSAAASVDPKARDMLARTEALARQQLMGLHGTMRGMRPVAPMQQANSERICTEQVDFTSWDPFKSLEERPRLDRIAVENGEIKTGDRVRLRPLGRADIFDMVLDGKTATVLSIEQDLEDRVHLAVSVDDDPGQDYGVSGKPGHRFFFGVDEVEPLHAVAASSPAKDQT